MDLSVEEKREYERMWRLAFPDCTKERLRRHRTKNPDWQKNYRRKHPETQKRYRLKNLAQYAAYSMKRTAIKQKATVGDLDAIQKIYDRCRELKKWFDVVVDHIIPLSRGGRHSARNLQIIYRSENCQKNNRLNFQPKVIFT